ncbi:ChaN family lipoprotein [uncultured Flavobacterium sp.]|uniref:ChaN family lipoprotein n=1 Tax=uncultured Flavobacterium sp. TaxID=165435 RepID=UPI0025E31CCC|nr:ChaN family lipoprotein [uncultured Flavobacterium sp.]
MFKKNILLLLILFPLCIFSQSDEIEKSVQYLSNNKNTPEEYIASKFAQKDIILLSEEHRVKENLQFVKNLIPVLYQNKVYNLGMEFGASENQAQLDSLISAPEYNKDLARKLMFNYNSGWAFKGYTDLYEAAWSFNKSLPKSSKKFRILNLSYRYDWSSFSGQRTSEKMKKVFYKGNTETYRFSIVEKEIVTKREKILILTGDVHAFTKYKFPVYDSLGTDFIRFEDGYFGNQLYAKYPRLVYSVLLHKPFSNRPDTKPNLISPADGKIEIIMEKINNTPVGFDLADTPLGKLKDNSYYSMGYQDFTLENFYDGYIFLAPINKLSGCDIDPKFLTASNWNEAQENVADPDWRPRPKNMEEYWKQIREYGDIAKKYGEVDKY